MKQRFYKHYLLIAAALFFLLSIPTFCVETARGSLMSMLSYFFKGTLLFSKKTISTDTKLEAENHHLRLEIGKLRALLEQRIKVDSLQEEIQYNPYKIKYYEEMGFLLAQIKQAIPACVIYRDPLSWSSTLWVNVGEETNRILKRQAIQRNSPVILGRAVVGAVDYVGRHQSRVRLITDDALKPSVRAVRGFSQNIVFIEHIDPLLRILNSQQDLDLTTREKNQLREILLKLRAHLQEGSQNWCLAKGIIQGGGKSSWRKSGQILRGIGFNYDFADAEGPARELITGAPVGTSAVSAIPIIKECDLLVTTGMDGVFPPGLRVAEVSKIYPLREGGNTYEIEAISVVGNLDTLQTVFIIPSLSDEEEATWQ